MPACGGEAAGLPSAARLAEGGEMAGSDGGDEVAAAVVVAAVTATVTVAAATVAPERALAAALKSGFGDRWRPVHDHGVG